MDSRLKCNAVKDFVWRQIAKTFARRVWAPAYAGVTTVGGAGGANQFSGEQEA